MSSTKKRLLSRPAMTRMYVPLGELTFTNPLPITSRKSLSLLSVVHTISGIGRSLPTTRRAMRDSQPITKVSSQSRLLDSRDSLRGGCGDGMGGASADQLNESRTLPESPKGYLNARHPSIHPSSNFGDDMPGALAKGSRPSDLDINPARTDQPASLSAPS
jgi:hypothetical protein